MINLVISIILAYPLGISGILLGTIISRLCVYFWYDPYIIHKTLFARSVSKYFKTYVIYAAVSICTGMLCSRIQITSSIINFIAKMIVCAIMPNIIFVIAFRHTDEFKKIKWYAQSLYQRRKNYTR